jgi:hypothetical protein
MRTFCCKVTALAALIMAATGCLLKDTTQTWYLQPGGSVTWTVVEANVRSDARAAFDRENEETGYWDAVKSETHPMAQAFRLLGATNVRTRIVRAEVPYTVVTDAKFLSLADLGRRLIVQTGLAGSSDLVRDGDAWQWTLTIRDPHATDSQVESDNAVMAVLESLDTLKIVLVAGRFDSAEGFVLSSDHRVATLDEKAMNSGDENPTVLLRLRWVDAVR